MTGRTHDLMAFTALNFAIVNFGVPQMTLATATVALSANFIGGLTPDIDQPTADLWNRLPAGSIIGRLICPILGGHRFISHSFLGIAVFAIGLHYLLGVVGKVLLVDMNIVWWSFMIGYVSHLLIDTVTRDGVPWLFPIPWKFGFPPFKIFRIKTGGMFEKSLIFPALMILNGYWIYQNYDYYLSIIRSLF